MPSYRVVCVPEEELKQTITVDMPEEPPQHVGGEVESAWLDAMDAAVKARLGDAWTYDDFTLIEEN